MRLPTQAETCTKGPSLPKHMPLPVAKTAPTAFAARTRAERNPRMTNPERMVLISGIPEPPVMYNPLGGRVKGSESSEGVGRER